ncbi:putative nacht and ankyrin domain protein [Botrytis fragariae]|uniref:Putative nacht and ankyrin domain protein n=1 Tax=Botrytis fragariae TaxID=1964551 RepID=A0A8H6ASE4_9HELO|nr:putative nacht and ankyrin domain protein [Botrytis fragariae]KAF5872951.1 putative nacht and ankyrin domain protein [Botrytis fragariae]
MHSKVVTTDEEDTCNTTILRDAYDEAVENRKESEKSLTILRLVQDGNIISLKLLLHGGGNVMATTDSGKTALHVAAFNGHLDILKLLLDTNIEHNAKDTAGRSALHDAARGGNFHIFRELIAAGLNLHDRNNNGEDPLCDACRNGHRDLVQEMLEIQSQLSLSDDSPMGSTPSERTIITQSTSDEYHDWVKTVGLKKYIKLAIENGHRAIAEIILVQHLDIDRKHLAYALQKAANRLFVPDTFRALRLAAGQNNIPIMKLLVEEGVPVDGYEADMFTQSPLLRAAKCGHSDAVEFLIEKGANPNRRSRNTHTTPLCEAIGCHNIKIATILIHAGADVNTPTMLGTALQRATRADKGLVALLLEAGANPNASVHSCVGTALQEAIKKGDKVIIDLLIEKGAKVNAPANDHSNTALQEAIKKGDKAIVDLLIEKGAEINASADYFSGTALQEAVKKGDKAIIDLLIEKGAEVNAPANDRSDTALQEAVKKGDKAIVDLLIEKGAEINASTNYFSSTALQEAVKKGDKAIIDLLIEKGAKVNTPAKGYSGTVLQEAVKKGNKVIINLLIKMGTEINAPANNRSGTALQEAVKKGDEATITQLIQLGADVNAPETPGEYWDPNPGLAIQEAAKIGDQIIVDMLLLAGADAKVRANRKCGTPLQEAVRHGNEYMVKQLIAFGVDVNASAVRSSEYSWGRNSNPEIAIREARKGRCQPIVDMLIQAGAIDPGED